MAYDNTHPARVVRGNGTAIAALIMGLIGIIMTVVTGWIPIVGFFLMLVPALLAIIFGFVGRAQARAGALHGAKAATGLTCGLVSLLLTVLMQLCWGLLLGGVVISSREIAHETAEVEEWREAAEDIERHVQAEWARMKAGHREIEIEIDNDASSTTGGHEAQSDRELTREELLHPPVQAHEVPGGGVGKPAPEGSDESVDEPLII